MDILWDSPLGGRVEAGASLASSFLEGSILSTDHRDVGFGVSCHPTLLST